MMLSHQNLEEGSEMTKVQRLSEWVEVLDDSATACLVEVAAILAADLYGMLEPENKSNSAVWDDIR